MHRQNEPLIIFLKDIWSLVFMNPQNMRPFYSLQLTMDLWRIGRNTQILNKVVFRNKIMKTFKTKFFENPFYKDYNSVCQ